MNGSDLYDRYGNDTSLLYPPCTASTRTANLQEQTRQNNVCSQPHNSNHAKMGRIYWVIWCFKSVLGTPALTRGKSKADLAAESAFSLSLMPTLLDTQQKVITLLAKFKKIHFRITIPIKECSSFIYCKAVRHESESVKIIYLDAIEFVPEL